jgi:hypothetical protein
MTPFIIKELRRLGFKTNQDEAGNVYAVRGKAKTYPLLNAHMDIVFDVDSDLFTNSNYNFIYEYDDDDDDNEKLCKKCENIHDCAMYSSTKERNWQECYNDLYFNQSLASTCTSYYKDPNWKYYSCYYEDDIDLINYYNYGLYSYSNNEIELLDELLKEQFEINYDKKTGLIKSNKLRVLGGDDKCGIAIALQAARELPKIPMKILFTVEEEIGCNGIERFIKQRKNWLDNVKYSLTLDRRDIDQLLMYSCGQPNCSKEFAAKIAAIGIRNNILVKMDEGTLADVIYIREHVKECVNMSAGYFNPHCLDEYVDFFGMVGIKNWVKAILLEM